jgi:3-hydroxyacyl-CoA dehydrogenase
MSADRILGVVGLVLAGIAAVSAWVGARVAIRKDRRDAAEALEARVRREVGLEYEVRDLQADRDRRQGDGE